MAKHQITAVRVESPGTQEEHITQLKLSTGTVETREKVHDNIKGGNEYYYTSVGGRKPRVEAATSAKGTKYVRTHPDDSKLDNLLNLPRF